MLACEVNKSLQTSGKITSTLYWDQPAEGFPVFVVKRKDGVGRKRTLHRNMILPVNYLPVTPLANNRQEKEKKLVKTQKKPAEPIESPDSGR